MTITQKKLVNERTFFLNAKSSARFFKKQSPNPTGFEAFYQAMDFLVLYEAGYNKLGLKHIIHLGIPQHILDEHTQKVWQIIQEFETLIEIFGVHTLLESSAISSDDTLIVSIYEYQ